MNKKNECINDQGVDEEENKRGKEYTEQVNIQEEDELLMTRHQKWRFSDQYCHAILITNN